MKEIEDANQMAIAEIRKITQEFNHASCLENEQFERFQNSDEPSDIPAGKAGALKKQLETLRKKQPVAVAYIQLEQLQKELLEWLLCERIDQVKAVQKQIAAIVKGLKS